MMQTMANVELDEKENKQCESRKEASGIPGVACGLFMRAGGAKKIADLMRLSSRFLDPAGLQRTSTFVQLPAAALLCERSK